MTERVVLITDHNREMCSMLSEQCSAFGLTVLVCQCVDAARDFLASNRPGIVILNLDLASEIAFNDCSEMLNNADLKPLSAIVITGRQDASIVMRCHALDAYFVPTCGDVWTQIYPLLLDLLGPAKNLSEKPDAQKPSSVSATITQPGIATNPSASQANDRTPAQRASDSLLDAVFAVLGNEAPSDGNVDTAGEAPWVLCIDDDSDVLDALAMRLNEQGIKVQRASAGRAGYRKAFTGRAKAIILDYSMPEGDGLYVLRRLKESPATRDIPVIVLTGARDKQVERQALACGVSAYLEKPCPWQTIWETLRSLITVPDKPLKDDSHRSRRDRPSVQKQGGQPELVG